MDWPKSALTERWGAQNFALFFPSPATVFHSFLPLLVFFVVVFEAPGRSNVHVWSSRAVVCEPRRPGLVGPPGFHTTAREPKRAHLRVLVFTTTPKIQRKGPTREGEKNKNCGRRGKKKSEILGGLAEGPRRGVRQRGSEHTHHTHTQHTTNKQKQTTENTFPHQNQSQQHTKKKDWPKMDWPKLDWPKLANHQPLTSNFGQKWIGQNWLAKHDGQKWIGQSRP